MPTIKLKAGKYLIPVTITSKGDKLWLSFRYNKHLVDEIKAMQGATWHGFDKEKPIKQWSISNNNRNLFQLRYLAGENPYAKYDAELIEIDSERPLYAHQKEMVAFGLTRQYCIFACEMGTGKTLAIIEIIERVINKHSIKNQDIWYIGPRSGVKAVARELIKWQAKFYPLMYTYEELVRLIKTWPSEKAAPKIVIFDESSKIKTPTAQRSLAAMHLAEAVRTEHGDNGYVFLLSGSPAPKSPLDWWHQCEVACPGFLREGTLGKFRQRLSITEQHESVAGGVYAQHVTWLDDEAKCKICGQLKDAPIHSSVDVFNGQEQETHKFEPSVNEIHKLYERMKGLVLVKFKKDCLDLPEKQYDIIRVQPSDDMLKASQLIIKTSRRAIEALTLLRELSDGFQYDKQETMREICPACKGNKIVSTIIDKDHRELLPCDYCEGLGHIPKIERTAINVSSPKDQEFIDLLDEYEDIGRFIVWGGFTATIDRLVEIAHKQGWVTLKVDGRGYHGSNEQGEIIDSDLLLDAMDLSHYKYKELLELFPKICFVGHPQAGGMALNLTASPIELFYSNTFNGEARIQAEDRFHRAGMNINRAAKIVDLICLPTDELVLENLKKKRRLQDLSMGELEACIK